MSIVRLVLRRPYTFMVMAILIAIMGVSPEDVFGAAGSFLGRS